MWEQPAENNLLDTSGYIIYYTNIQRNIKGVARMNQYLQCLLSLKKRLPADPDVFRNFSTLEERLLDNLHCGRLGHRNGDILLAERANVLQELDTLTQRLYHQNFLDIAPLEDEFLATPAVRQAAHTQPTCCSHGLRNAMANHHVYALYTRYVCCIL